MSDVERKALDVAARAERDGTAILNAHQTTFTYRTHESVVRALSRAGLLRTDLHERALEACKDFNLNANGVTSRQRALDVVFMVGRDALALEKPKERWTVKRYDDNGLRPWRVFDALMPNGCGDLHGCCAKFSFESDARAYAAQKNREEAAR